MDLGSDLATLFICTEAWIRSVSRIVLSDSVVLYCDRALYPTRQSAESAVAKAEHHSSDSGISANSQIRFYELTSLFKREGHTEDNIA